MMSDDEKKSSSIFSTVSSYNQSKTPSDSSNIIADRQNHKNSLESSVFTTNKVPLLPSDEQALDNDWELVGSKKLNKIRQRQTKILSPSHIQSNKITNQPIKNKGVHSYFSHGSAKHPINPRSQQVAPTDRIHGKYHTLQFPPFKIEFKDQQKPPEIQVLNDLVKHNHLLNVTSASYSKHIQSQHILLLFVKDPSTYELLFNNTSWPNLICNLPFNVTSPRRIPPAYSILVNQIPRDWNVENIHPLLINRYPSINRITRIFRDEKPTARIRIDFHSQDDVQSILQPGYIYIDSLRYPATSYKPLFPITRCYKCQQYGHTPTSYTNAAKCFKCGELHLYNPDCSNTIKCAGLHMTGSPDCPVKISYRKQQQQQQSPQHITRISPESHLISYLPSPSRLYSNVLQAASSNIESPSLNTTNTTSLTSPYPQDTSSTIIQTLKDEIGKSQSILLEKLILLDQKCETATQHQMQSQHILQTEVLSYLTSMSDLIVHIYDSLIPAELLPLTNQHKTKLNHIRNLTTVTSNSSTTPLRPLLSRTRAQPNLCPSLSSMNNNSLQLTPIPSTIIGVSIHVKIQLSSFYKKCFFTFDV